MTIPDNWWEVFMGDETIIAVDSATALTLLGHLTSPNRQAFFSCIDMAGRATHFVLDRVLGVIESTPESREFMMAFNKKIEDENKEF